MQDLPKGWAVCKLGDVIFVKNGYAFKSKTYSSDGIPLVRISDIKEGKISLKNSVKIPIHEVKKDFLIFDGDLLIAMSGATTGKMGVYLGIDPCLQNQRVGNFKIRSDRGLDSKFRNFLVFSLRKDIELAAYGGAQPNISASMLENFTVPLPPLNEQRRIVAKLEKLLAKVNACGDRLDKISTILKRFRQSVLAAACSGRLTADWREQNPDIEPAEELLKRIKKARLIATLKPREVSKIDNIYKDIKEDNNLEGQIPESWMYCQVDHIGNVCNGSTPSRKHIEYWNGEISWVSSGEVRNNVIQRTRETITTIGYNNSSVRLLPIGTVLIAMIGEGKTRGRNISIIVGRDAGEGGLS